MVRITAKDANMNWIPRTAIPRGGVPAIRAMPKPTNSETAMKRAVRYITKWPGSGSGGATRTKAGFILKIPICSTVGRGVASDANVRSNPRQPIRTNNGPNTKRSNTMPTRNRSSNSPTSPKLMEFCRLFRPVCGRAVDAITGRWGALPRVGNDESAYSPPGETASFDRSARPGGLGGRSANKGDGGTGDRGKVGQRSSPPLEPPSFEAMTADPGANARHCSHTSGAPALSASNQNSRPHWRHFSKTDAEAIVSTGIAGIEA